ncbi:MAG TPA: DUF5335 domain-containing protein [Telluria sp.]|nr:DUF5335 domain-containing protein [Telluria sp.]
MEENGYEEMKATRLGLDVPAPPVRMIKIKRRANIMATVKLDKAAWQKTFDQMSKSLLVGKQVEIEVIGLNIGAQIEQKWIQLMGISYDPKDDLIEILVEGLDHLIPKPREVWVDQGATGLASIEVVDADDVRQIIRLREPLMLPSSAAA